MGKKQKNVNLTTHDKLILLITSSDVVENRLKISANLASNSFHKSLYQRLKCHLQGVLSVRSISHTLAPYLTRAHYHTHTCHVAAEAQGLEFEVFDRPLLSTCPLVFSFGKPHPYPTACLYTEVEKLNAWYYCFHPPPQFFCQWCTAYASGNTSKRFSCSHHPYGYKTSRPNT